MRDARLDDTHAVRRIAKATWDHTYRDTVPEEVRAEFVRRAYSDESLVRRIENDVFLVATRDHEIFGFADFLPDVDGRVELAAIYVLPQRQGRGLGSRLLETGLGRFPPNTTFVLSVERENLKARGFYEARGFRPVRELVDVYLGHEFHDVEMVLEPGSYSGLQKG